MSEKTLNKIPEKLKKKRILRPVSHLYIFFGKNIYSVLLPFHKSGFFFILSYMNCLFILNINPFWSYHLPIFSSIQQVVFPFVQKLLSLIRFHLFIFLLCPFLEEKVLKNIAKTCQRVYCLCILLEFYGFWSYIKVFNPF